MFDYSILKPQELHFYEKLTFPAYKTLLKNPKHFSDIIAIGASFCFYPIGLILATISFNKASILSIYVDANYRKMGVGSTLYELLEQKLLEKECDLVSIDYMSNSSTSLFLQKLLKKQHFLISEPTTLYLYYNPKDIISSPIVKKTLKLPKNIEISPLLDLTNEDIETYYKISSSPTFSKELLIDTTDFPLEPISSLALKKDNKLIGWLVTHRIDTNTVRYTTLYIEPSENQLYSLCLINDALKKHTHLHCPPTIIQAIPYKFQSMINLAKKKFAPYSFKIHDGLHSYKQLRQ